MMEQQSKENSLVIIHFNDTYNIEERKEEPVAGVARFVTALRAYEKLNPLILFSGDIFSPSALSVIYEGEHMIKPINSFGIHCACVGNHDFDFDNDQVTSLLERCNFPWLLTNVKLKTTGSCFSGTEEFMVIEHNKLRIGLIGLAEFDWIATLSNMSEEDLDYEDFVTCGERWAKHLKQEEKCDFVIALTHMRDHSDRSLAQHTQEIDLILGGHDHIYHNFKINDKFIVKSGTDFREFNIIRINFFPKDKVDEIIAKPEKHPEFKAENICKNSFHVDFEKVEVTTKWEPDPELQKHVNFYQEQYAQSMQKLLAYAGVNLETRFSKIRSEETNFGNFLADLCRIHTGSDVAIINAGTIRSDCIVPKGPLHLKDIKTILPMPDKCVKLEISGETLVKALENGVSRYPSLEGRFPCVSGMSFCFDPNAISLKRIRRDSVRIGGLPLDPTMNYTLVCKAFIAGGKDGYDALGGCKRLIDEEAADDIETVLIKFLDLANDKEIEEELIKQFKYDPKKNREPSL